MVKSLMDEIGRGYLTLALNLNRHVEGFVDAYYGPPELKAEVQKGNPSSVEALADDVRQLQAAIAHSDYDPQRKEYLGLQVRAMAGLIRKLLGDELDFVEEVELYFDITPQMLDEAVFEQIHADMDRLFPGGGSVLNRVASWKKGVEIQSNRLLPVLELAVEETRRRTSILFDLPRGEEVSLRLVEDEPWTAYNWYLGAYRSRIDANTDPPLRVDHPISLVTHEAYPGHHTEHAVKEHWLYRQKGRAEHSVLLSLAPESVVSEGIAETAESMIFSPEELEAFLHDRLNPLAGLPDVGVAQQMGWAKARDELRVVGANAALLLHEHGRPPEEVREYMERYGLRTPREVAKGLEFIQNPLWRSYIFSYNMGKQLLAPLLEGPDAVANFRRLLSEPFTPTQVRQWIADRGADTAT
ncbi:MAG: hypothetical protein GTO63_18215 [Anaerolineae bacterium]|nr:hypothetical protein [Anaerolineae bacterium]NIN96706.1 hypothetical protein [Anaerolineae bacterium]NIQ79717.1 hypothetical protein [Anaerolineae bacterium]